MATTGWRPIDEGTGDEAGWVEGDFLGQLEALPVATQGLPIVKITRVMALPQPLL